MDPNTNPAGPFVEYLEWFHMRIKLLPLAAPVGSNSLLPDHTPSFRCLGPAYVVAHNGQCSIDVPLVESRIGLSDKSLCLRHLFLAHSDGFRVVGVMAFRHLDLLRSLPGIQHDYLVRAPSAGEVDALPI